MKRAAGRSSITVDLDELGIVDAVVERLTETVPILKEAIKAREANITHLLRVERLFSEPRTLGALDVRDGLNRLHNAVKAIETRVLALEQASRKK